mgnify:CR=1 FL=1
MKVVFAGNNAYIEIEIIAYERPDPLCRDDANWLSCRFGWQLGNSMMLKADLALQTNDFDNLAKDIEQFESTSRKIIFCSSEKTLCFEIEKNKNEIMMAGQLAVTSGYAKCVSNFSFPLENWDAMTTAVREIALCFPVLE